MRKADHADGRGQQKQQPLRSLYSVKTQREPGDAESCEQRGNGAWQSRSGFAHAKPLEAKPGAPVIKRWLLEPRPPVEPRCDPVMRLHHGPGDPGVTRLIRTDESQEPKMAEVADVKSDAQEHAPPNQGASGHAAIRGCRRAWFLHGRLSLTLKDFLPPQTSCILSRNGSPLPVGSAMKARLEYAAVWLIVKGLGLLPRPLARRIASALTRFCYVLLPRLQDRKSTRLNSSHLVISYAVFCLKKKKKIKLLSKRLKTETEVKIR